MDLGKGTTPLRPRSKRRSERAQERKIAMTSGRSAISWRFFLTLRSTTPVLQAASRHRPLARDRRSLLFGHSSKNNAG